MRHYPAQLTHGEEQKHRPDGNVLDFQHKLKPPEEKF